MHRLGPILLRFGHWFHKWHRQHLTIAVLLLALSVVAAIARFAGLLGETIARTLSEAEHILSAFTVWFFAAYLLLYAFAYLIAKFWPPRLVPHVTHLPAPLQTNPGSHWIFAGHFGAQFRFRYAAMDDLPLFVEYSTGDLAILMASPDLDEQKRLEVYRRWYSLNPESFMFCERKDVSEAIWRTFAVSIVLPLSEAGVRDLWSGQKRVVELDANHICKSGRRPRVVLVDTLIVTPRDKGRELDIVFALPKLHASRFWVPEGKKRIEYWIEPDHRKLPKVLPKLGFEGPHKIAKGHELFALRYPDGLRWLSPNQRETASRLLEDIKECSRWAVI